MTSRIFVALLTGGFFASILPLAGTWGVPQFDNSLPFNEPAPPQPTIFVSIGSFRDRQCSNTLIDLFEKADNPQNIFVGTCEQNLEPDEACVGQRLGAHAARVRRVLLNASEAQGPTYARYLASMLYRGETFYLQLDSHMRFVQGWDSRLLRMHAALPEPHRACITGYPAAWEDVNQTQVPVMCQSHFGPDDVLTFGAILTPPTSAPLLVPFTAAGFLFAPGSVILDCPFDPDLPELFQGEEALYSARLWTHGYNFWAPSENVVFHYYYREDEPKYFDARGPSWYEQHHSSNVKVMQLLAGKMPGYPYGFGHNRTLQQYWDFARVDLDALTTNTNTTFCPPQELALAH